MNDFDGLVAVVTGGASGIGAATAALLAERGARVAVLDRNVESVDEARRSASSATSPTRRRSRRPSRRWSSTSGRLDIVVNNAGIGAEGDVAANGDEEWHRVLDVNVVGLARVSRAALPHLRESEHAAIVNTCSVVAVVGVRNRALYSASKGAVARRDARDGRRPRRRRHPGERRRARHGRHALGRAAARQRRGSAPRPGRAAGAPAHGPARHGRRGRARHRLPRHRPLSASTTGTLLAVDGGMSTLRI